MLFERYFRLSEGADTGIHCTGEGLLVGGVTIVERRRTGCTSNVWRVRPLDEINRDLSRRFGSPIDFATKMPGAETVAEALEAQNLARAQIAALLLQIPDPPSSSKAYTELEAVELTKALRISRLLKEDWDPDKHPRWPAGSPDSTGGQFAPSGAAEGGGDTLEIIPAQATTIAPPMDIPVPIPFPFPSEIVPPLVAPNDILPRSLPQNPYPSRPECAKEWQEAQDYCRDLKTRGLLGRGDYRGMGRTVRECILGQVSESCGGNAASA